jgi:hypothetical protein
MMRPQSEGWGGVSKLLIRREVSMYMCDGARMLDVRPLLHSVSVAHV